jgi:glycosyltransferase involved in cell wall biosynthesis
MGLGSKIPTVRMPLVSIIIPCFNHGKYLGSAIDSALSQSCRSVQVIVINDGSSDETDAVAKSYGQSIVYINQDNRGLSAARNVGIAASTAKYLAFLDADDILSHTAIECALVASEERDDVFVVAGWRKFVDDIEVPIEADKVKIFSNAFPHLIHDNLAPPHAYLVPRLLAEQVKGFNTQFRSCEDWDFWARLAINGAILKSIPHLSAFYRVLPNSMSSNRLRMIETRISVLHTFYSAFQENPELMNKWGLELANAVKRVRRRVRAQDLPVEWDSGLSKFLLDLSGINIYPEQSRAERLLSPFVGREAADSVVLYGYKYFYPKSFLYFLEGHA